jgi:hypothetical protein
MTTTRGIRSWARKRALIAAGRCRECGRPRGARGTAQHCRACATAHATLVRHRSRRLSSLANLAIRAGLRAEDRRDE